ncbi:MAG TPA: ABC transporter ATP-binding protein [Acidimicrobiales bacterium]
MSDLEITGLDKSYRTQSVLRNLDLTVKEGTFVSILGPSGSGKTSLLRVIAGFDRADRGTVRLGESIVDDPTHFIEPDRRRIGYVPQDGSLFPHLSVMANVGFGLARRDRNGTRVEELLEMVGLGGMAERYPHQLSGGQQQRVALARGLAIDPDLVLLDEPFSSLDASLRASVRHDVRLVLREAGTTAILVTHDQDEALSLADQVAIMHDGHVSQCDAPATLYAKPSTPELARELGEVNFLTGTKARDGVETPLGTLRLESSSSDLKGASDGTALLVLVRPEQIVIDTDLSEARGTATVVHTEFYGHDAVVKLRADWDESIFITVRTSEASALPLRESCVALRVRGSVVAWRQ